MEYPHDGCVWLKFTAVFEVLVDEFDFNPCTDEEHWNGRPGRTNVNVRTLW